MFSTTPNPYLNQHFSKLAFLNLSCCKSLEILPSGIHFEFLKKLNVSGCSKLKRLPEILSAGITEEIILSGTAIEELPPSIELLPRLFLLDISHCKRLKSLPSSLCNLTSLKLLRLSGCSNLLTLPENLGNLESLAVFTARETAIREVASSIFCLNNFQGSCFKERGVSLLPTTLSLDHGLHKSLWSLDLSGCGIMELPETIGMLPSLEWLLLEKNNFEKVPDSIIRLSNLTWLQVSYCERLRSLPKLPCSLRELDAHHCTALESLSGWFRSGYFDLRYNFQLNRNEGTGILNDALREIQTIANNRSSRKIHCIVNDCFVMLPGSEIPKWFRHQNFGGVGLETDMEMAEMETDMEMPPAAGSKVVGFAYSLIVPLPDHHVKAFDRLELYCEFKLKPKDLCSVRIAKDVSCLLNEVESDHLLLGFHIFDQIYEANVLAVGCVFESVKFYYITYEPLEYCPVTKCGFRLLYSNRKRKRNSEEAGTTLFSKLVNYTLHEFFL